MEVDVLFDSLCSIGRSGQYSDVLGLPGAGVHREVLRIGDTHAKVLIGYFDNLPHSNRPGFVKAVAAYEDTVGGVGSVTTLHKLLPRLSEKHDETLDWILANTRSYWWYSHGARSVSELAAIKQANKIRQEESLAREHQREVAAKTIKAKRASGNLFNAVRRGDIKAVKALLDQGADLLDTSVSRRPPECPL